MSSPLANSPQAEPVKQLETLFAALIPCDGFNLLLPNALVATTLGLDLLLPPQAAPAWLAGSVRVQGVRVAVLRVEMMFSSDGGNVAAEPLHRKSRIVVLRAKSYEPAFAMIALGAPRLVNVNALVLKPVALLSTDAPNYCACRAQLGHTEVLIPNIDALAQSAEAW